MGTPVEELCGELGITVEEFGDILDTPRDVIDNSTNDEDFILE